MSGCKWASRTGDGKEENRAAGQRVCDRWCCCAAVGVACHGRFAAARARWWPCRSSALVETEEKEQRKGMGRGGEGQVSYEGGEKRERAAGDTSDNGGG